ncbi:hypothetical protein ZWY2020_037007 [Hordeum vulgare]|nr:hypothetical protein ZWY2020_037007 [Hordeum vulgare]
MPGCWATKFMAVVDTLSTHSPTRYLGESLDEGAAPWTGDEALEAHGMFAADVRRAERPSRRNADHGRRNRCSAGCCRTSCWPPARRRGHLPLACLTASPYDTPLYARDSLWILFRTSEFPYLVPACGCSFDMDVSLVSESKSRQI